MLFYAMKKLMMQRFMIQDQILIINWNCIIETKVALIR